MNLNRSSLPDGLRIGAPAPERTGMVHLGLGQFHRAHAAVNTALALQASPGDWGIVGVANRSRHVADGLRSQDFLYSVLTLDPAAEEVGIVDVHRRALVAHDEPDQVLAALADPQHRIVTLTISEKAYHRTTSGEADLTAFADEIAAGRATSPLGLLAHGLRQRAASQAPLTVLSCDNVQGNGDAARQVLFGYLQALGTDDATLGWIEQNVTFPNSMVDRIVPGTTDETRARVEQLLGLHDQVPVPAERFTMWVMQDHFAAGRPQWEAAGAIFTDEVDRYELVKLRILNGMHSLISYLGALDGRETIPAAREQDFVEQAVRAAIYDECLPSITLPTGFDFDAYVEELFVRWSNTSLGDRISRVGSDGSAKLLQRLPEPALLALGQDRMPQMMALLLAAWIACVTPIDGLDAGPVAAAMDEPQREELARIAGGRSPEEQVRAVLDRYFPAALAGNDEFAARAAELLAIIVRDGVRAATREALQGAADTRQEK